MSALSEIAALLGDDHVLTAAESVSQYLHDERGLFSGRAAAVVRPGTRAELAQAMAICHRHRVAMVPQGGNTGYCGGATPDQSGTQIVIALGRLDRLIATDVSSMSLTLEAGVSLAAAQDAARQADLLLPLSMGSQGSCQIGGNLATNAGGLAVLRYGTARDLCLGLEFILADGRRVDQLSGLRKDNTGYALGQLMIGAEGTLGIIAAATLKLFPRAARQRTLFAAVRDVASAGSLLAALRGVLGDNVTSFEYLSAQALDCATQMIPDLTQPLDGRHAHFVLAEWAEFGPPPASDDALEAVLAKSLDEGAVADVVLAHNERQRLALWRLRESVPAAEKLAGGSIKHDISVALGDVPTYIERAQAGIAQHWPDARLSVYGHIGDGNVHFNVLAPAATDSAAFRVRHAAAISDLLHDLAHTMRGSFSAEHGVGQLKRELLQRYDDGISLDLMRALKGALDPLGLMNPGKIV